MSSKHTPGPWVVTPHPDQNVDVFAVGEITDEAFQYGLSHTICYQNAEANARLIAAAPALLDLLERVTYHMEGGIRLEYPASPEESPQPASEWDHGADRLAGEARRLLAKAVGPA